MITELWMIRTVAFLFCLCAAFDVSVGGIEPAFLPLNSDPSNAIKLTYTLKDGGVLFISILTCFHG
jgi:hypothetical protein